MNERFISASSTVGEIDATVPESLNMKFKKIIVKGKDAGKDVTNKIEFTTDMIGKSREDIDKLEWAMFEDAGGLASSQRNFKVNPYKFARQQYSVYIDPSVIISRSMGTDQMRKERAFNMMLNPMVAPYVNMEAAVDKFILQEYSDGDPDELKSKNPPQQGQPQGQQMPGGMLGAVMGQQPAQVGTPNQ